MAAYRIRWASKGGKVFIFDGSYNTRNKAEAETPKISCVSTEVMKKRRILSRYQSLLI
jgi:hypothetical protein